MLEFIVILQCSNYVSVCINGVVVAWVIDITSPADLFIDQTGVQFPLDAWIISVP